MIKWMIPVDDNFYKQRPLCGGHLVNFTVRLSVGFVSALKIEAKPAGIFQGTHFSHFHASVYRRQNGEANNCSHQKVKCYFHCESILVEFTSNQILFQAFIRLNTALIIKQLIDVE